MTWRSPEAAGHWAPSEREMPGAGRAARAVPDEAEVAAWAPSVVVAGAGGEPCVGSAWCAGRGGTRVSARWMLALALR